MFWLLSRRRMKTLEMGDGWWGSGDRLLRDKDGEGIRPFQVKASEKEIQVLVGSKELNERNLEETN